jgi:MFS superfamily sulfate permease-like transporter
VDLAEVKIIGHIPAGLRGHRDVFGGMDAKTRLSVLRASISIALVGYIEAITIASTGSMQTCVLACVCRVSEDVCHLLCTSSTAATAAARKYGGRFDSSQEMLALGVLNLFGSQFQGFPVTGV